MASGFSFPLDDILGTMLIGVVFSSVLYGVTCMQVYLYYTRYSQVSGDGLMQKCLVFMMWLLESCHTAIITFSLYKSTVTNFGNYLILILSTWDLSASYTFSTIITQSVQLFFAWRVYSISDRNTVLVAFIVFLSVAAQGLSLAFTFKSFPVGRPVLANEHKSLSIVALGFDLLCDTLISVAMCYYLHRKRTGFKHSNQAINTLITYSINTGLISTIVTSLCLITFLCSPTTNAIAPFSYTLCRVYVISLLSTLNCREGIRKTLHSGGIVPLSSVGGKFSASKNPTTISINVEEERWMKRDKGPGESEIFP